MTPAARKRKTSPRKAMGKPRARGLPVGVARYRTAAAIANPSGTRKRWIIGELPLQQSRGWTLQIPGSSETPRNGADRLAAFRFYATLPQLRRGGHFNTLVS